EQTLSRADVEAALPHAPLVFQECDLDGADLSRLDLRNCTFISCSIAETSFYAAKLGQTTWQRCRGRQADFEAADLTDARFQGC
ncbi:pentapeptide repeat-containing protein, partial [Campylobacter coli]|uniref:pentapeptide repeat-containing protein n=1 Tax=Campylobacter coli TaxID=195 RepID=UPI0025B188D6